MLTMAVKKLVLHRRKDQAAVAAGTRRTLMREGALVRKVMRNSIRRRKASAAPGQPPAAHAPGGSGLKLILYAWDPSTRSVPVGVIPYASREAPALAERGGTAVRRDKRTGRRRLVRYRKHPFAWPALQAAAPKFPPLWRDAIRG